MRRILHAPLDPGSRKVRLMMAEKGLAASYEEEQPWERRRAFLAMNPAGEVPVLIDPDGHVVAGARAVAAYIEACVPEPPLLPADPRARAEVWRLESWFEDKFAREVTDNLVGEKVLRRLAGTGEPSSEAIRAGRHNIRIHLDYIGWLMERRRWLAGDDLTLADLAAAAHFSAVDYIGDVPWDDAPGAKDWYARIKSRPSFRPLLEDRLPGLPPPRHYADLDF